MVRSGPNYPDERSPDRTLRRSILDLPVQGQRLGLDSIGAIDEAVTQQRVAFSYSASVIPCGQ